MIEIRRPIIPKVSRKQEIDDGIAEDVRKIKESMKEQEKSTASTTPLGRKSRAALTKVEKQPTPKAVVKPRTSKRSAKAAAKEPTPESSIVDDDKEKKVEQKEEEKAKVNEELKKELLADWLDEDDLVVSDKNGKLFIYN